MAAAALPSAFRFLAGPAEASDTGAGRRHYSFVAVSGATIGGNPHRIVVEGFGHFEENGGVSGGGSFVHWIAVGSTPFPIVASGKWRAHRFLGYTKGFGSFGRIEASVLDLGIVLLPDGGPPVSGTLRLVCNIGPAGIVTGEGPEGFVLTTPGATFSQLSPIAGLVHISIPINE